MDFFTAQDRARRATGVYVAAFMGALVVIIAAITVVVRLILSSGTHGEYDDVGDVQLFLVTALVVVGIVGLAALVRAAQFSIGGGAVAKSLGGRLLDPSTRQPDERRLLNVVEEMAIASGVPVPEVYVLDEEEGINAFAAGFSTNDAAVAVTAGGLRSLNRDELQGVIGHEFSHILNGDMRLNIRMASLIFGIFVISVIGRLIVQSLGRGRVRTREKSGGGVAGILILGVALMLIGWIGVLAGRLIQAAISRHREFLADASAVQFTRNPAGLSGALRKIAGAEKGSRLVNPQAAGLAHCFFGDPSHWWLNWFATHPPIELRIAALEGIPASSVEIATSVREKAGASTAAGVRAKPRGTQPATLRPIALSSAIPPPQPLVSSPEAGTVPTARQPGQRLLAETYSATATPLLLREVSHSPEGSEAIILALFLREGGVSRDDFNRSYAGRLAPAVASHIREIWPSIATLASAQRLSLVESALPNLRRMDPAENTRWMSLCHEIATRDGRVSIFEFALLGLIAKRLHIYLTSTLLAPLPDKAAELWMAAFAQAAHRSKTAGEIRPMSLTVKTEATGARSVHPSLSFEELAASLTVLAVQPLNRRRGWLEEAARQVTSDGHVDPSEAELIRVFAAGMDLPAPPLV